jgi:hypothetical protein
LRAAGNAFAPLGGFTGGCDSPTGSIVWLIDALGNENRAAYPCFERLTLMDLVGRKAFTWRYYVGSVGPGLWNAPDAIAHIRDSGQYTFRVVAPPKQILTDIANGRLANVVWVTPTTAASDHPGQTNGSGPSWVASVVNAVGKSSYWSSSAIFVTWDDWGGWYDHVSPPYADYDGLGIRVPFIIISPYTKRGLVTHTLYEQASILKYIEDRFGLPTLSAADARAKDPEPDVMSNRGATPRPFATIPAGPYSKPDDPGAPDY